jgi:CheY-like chemotaxis protein
MMTRVPPAGTQPNTTRGVERYRRVGDLRNRCAVEGFAYHGVHITATRGTPVPLVLVVDDQASVRLLVRAILAVEDYRVSEAADGIDAWDIMKAERPDLVLMDVMMPGPSGLDVCRYMRADPDLAGVPVLIITAGGQAERTAAEAYRAGANAFMAKPFSPAALLGAVAKLLAGASVA